MKKKLLSLVLAGAMVAGSSVSAFAADTVLNAEGNADVTITGKVVDDRGNEPAGTIKVSVPTSATFMVNQQGNLQGTTINVTNNGDQNVDIYAEQFRDLTKEDGAGITVVAESALKSKKRTYVSLSLQGKAGNVYLKTETDGNGKGLYKNMALSEAAVQDADLKLTSIAPGQTEGLRLQGRAGENNNAGGNQDQKVEQAVSNDFTLTLKIKKAAN